MTSRNGLKYLLLCFQACGVPRYVIETGIEGAFWTVSDFMTSPLGAWLSVETDDGTSTMPIFLLGFGYTILAIFIWNFDLPDE
jgi:hypothetical protein